MKSLIVSDLHLTSNPRDEYRWRLFDWICESPETDGIDTLYILGDITEAKDFHSARLVNRIVDSLLRVYRKTRCKGIVILRGNHDGIDPRCSYFRFLGQYPSIQFVDTPYMSTKCGREVLLLPNTKDPVSAWADVDMHEADLIFMHATVTGALSENGMVMEGTPMGALALARRAKIYSGDIHVPQVVGKVEYIGAPYPIRFGDAYTGRAVLLDNYRNARDLFPPTIQRKYITVMPTDKKIEGLDELSKGDQVKVRIRLAPHEYVDWQRMKKNAVEACNHAGIELCGLELERVAQKAPLGRVKIQPRQQQKTLSPNDLLCQYCTTNKIGVDVLRAGQSILKSL